MGRRRSTQKSMLDFALEYAAAGLPVVPLHSVLEDGSCTCGASTCKAAGKHPRTRNGLKSATTDEAQIKKWWGETRWPNASIGGVGGSFLCLDIDAKSDGFTSLRKLVASNAPLPDTAVAETGEYEVDGELQRGRHYWFRVPEDLAPATRAGVRPGIDIRCHNGYAVLPPSSHVSGVSYEWIDGDIAEAVEAPEWVCELVPEVLAGDSKWAPDPNFKMSKEVKEFLRGTRTVPPGEQRDFLTRAARAVLTTGKSVEDAARLLWEGYSGEGGICASDWDDEPWQDDEVLQLVEDIFRHNPPTPLEKDFDDQDIHQTDVGNAKLLIAAFPQGHLFHVLEWDKWYIWDAEEEKFIEDAGREMRVTFEDKVTREMMAKAQETRSEDEAKRIFQHALRSQQRPRVEAAVHLARDFVATPHSDLNADPFLLSVENGVVDLTTGELHTASPEHLITKHSRVVYDPDVKTTIWRDFLESVVPDKDLRDFLQKAFGYTLTGSVDEHKFFYLHGPPASGKSTLLEAFAYLMGNYAESADPSTFMRNPNRQSAGPSEDVARLANARLVVTHEIEEGMRFAEGHLSKLTGGDTVPARFLHQKTFTFRPKFKLWFSANHKPRVSGSSRSGLWRRILVIPMEETVPEEERDPTLPRQLREGDVLSEMLNWAIEGTLKWVEDNDAGRLMAVPEIIKGEVEEYRQEADHVQAFVAEALDDTQDDKDRVPKQDMYQAYLGWCDKEGRKHTLTKNSFTRRMQDLGFTWKQAQFEGARPDCWMGVRVIGAVTVKKKRESK